MFQLFKERKFNDYINDTFLFLKVHGKHFFKTYFVVNGGLLLIATVLIYFLSKIYLEFITTSIGGNASDNFLNNFFNENFTLMIIAIILAFLFFMIISIVQFSFPVVYFDLLDQKKGENFSAKDILNGIKLRIYKILKFIIGSIFIIFPLMMIVFGLLILLCFIIIGIPLLLIMIPAMMSFMNLTFYYYMNSEQSFFTAIGDSFDTIRNQFWPIVGTTTVMLIIIQVVNMFFTAIPYFIAMASFFTSIREGSEEDVVSFLSVMMTVIMVFSTILSFILNNLMLISQGVIYYSHIENNESSIYKDTIDLIGSESE